MSDMTCQWVNAGEYQCVQHVGSFMAYPDQPCERARINAAVARCEETAGDHPDRDIAADYSPLLARDVLVILRGES